MFGLLLNYNRIIPFLATKSHVQQKSREACTVELYPTVDIIWCYAGAARKALFAQALFYFCCQARLDDRDPKAWVGA